MALLGAAMVVLYLDTQAVASRDHQNALLRHEIFDHLSSNVAAEIKETFDGPVFDTLAGVNHPVLKAGRLDVVAKDFREGLQKYPQVGSFFVWNAATASEAATDVLFFDRHSEPMPAPASGSAGQSQAGKPDSQALRQVVARFRRDPEMAAVILKAVARHAPSQQIYLAIERTVHGHLYDIFVRLFWVDANRAKYFAVLGFVVDLADVRTTMFPELFRQHFADLLRRESDLPGLELRVLDEADHLVFGPPLPIPPYAGESQFSLQFYPADAIRSRTSAGIADRRWRVTVSQAASGSTQASDWLRSPPHMLSGLSVVLMLVALAFVVVENRRAGQLSRMQSDFVSHVSHQLKTPLSLLSAVCETLGLERMHSPEKVSQYVGIIRSETARLSALVERILEYSRVEQRGRGYEFEPVDLVALVHETVEAFAGPLGDKVEIHVEDTGGRPMVSADGAALEQVLVNLLDNALKYSDKQKYVLVRVGWAGADGVISVIDRGIGIDAADRRRIFEKFYRGAGAAHSREGFGLGLVIVSQLVKAHHGTIEVTSAPGQGSTFTIKLPRLSESYRETSVAAPEPADASGTT